VTDTRRRVHNLVRVAFAVTTVVAMAWQFASLHVRGLGNAGNFFSFFTIQSNILAALALVLLVVVRREERSAAFDSFRSAVTLFITITGVVFAVLLAGHAEDVQTAIPWVDFVVHKLTPVVVVADWLIDPPRHRLSLRAAATWLLYPLAWFAYTLIRGAGEHWYPYPFVNVDEHGYGHVLTMGVVLLVFFAAASAAFVVVGNRRGAVSAAA
jgi:hypothetical protein